MAYMHYDDEDIVPEDDLKLRKDDFMIEGDNEAVQDDADDFYSESEVEDELDDDRLSGREAAFMRGYIDDLS